MMPTKKEIKPVKWKHPSKKLLIAHGYNRHIATDNYGDGYIKALENLIAELEGES